MAESWAVDTNVVIAFFEREGAVVERFDAAGRLVVPAVVLGELYMGAFYSSRRAENLHRIEKFIVRASLAMSDRGTAREYGLIQAELRRTGRPIPDNDAWIAAVARQHDLTLVTRDQHFEAVDRLRTERW